MKFTALLIILAHLVIESGCNVQSAEGASREPSQPLLAGEPTTHSVLRISDSELKRVKKTQQRVIKEAPIKLLVHIKNQHKMPYPFTELMSKVNPDRAVIVLARLLADKRFQNFHGFGQILNSLAILQVDGAGKAIADTIKSKAYEEYNTDAMLVNAIAAFSPSEIKQYKNLLLPYLKCKSIILRLVTTFRLANNGVVEGEQIFTACLLKPDRFFVGHLKATRSFTKSLAKHVLESLSSAKTEQVKRLIAHVLQHSPLKERPEKLKAFYIKEPDEFLQTRLSNRKELLQMAFEVMPLRKILSSHKPKPTLFCIEDVGDDFSLDGRTIKLLTRVQASALGEGECGFGVQTRIISKDDVAFYISFGPSIKNSAFTIKLKKDDKGFKVQDVKFHPGK